MKTASDIMTVDVITVTQKTSVQELARILTENSISGAPVLDEDGCLVGIVTESDLIDQNKKIHIPTVVSILDSFFYLESPNRMEQEMRKIAGATVGDILSAKIVTVTEDTPIDELATIMSEQNIHTLPVMRDNKISGIIGKKDIIKTIAS